MRKEFIWGDSHYVYIYKDGTKSKLYKTSCFSGYLRSDEDIEYIKYSNINCKITKDYYNFYLEYITDMLKLDSITIGKNSFTFKVYDCKYKTLLVLSLVRMLYEKLGYQNTGKSLEFLKLLKHGKSKYRNKLKRFCDFYSRLSKKDEYWHTGHSWYPNETEIKSTKDWLNTKTLTSVNTFFTTK